MKIPRIPTPDGISGKAWSETGTNGKGSRARNISDKFRANFPKGLGNKKTPGHTRIVYK